MVRVKIKGIIIDQEIDLPIVILANREENVIFPILVSPAEANAIVMELKGIKSRKPVVLDLLVDMFKKHRCHVLYLEIYGIEEDEFLSRLIYRKGLFKHAKELRISDGIALAARLEVPIMVDKNVISYESQIEDLLEENFEGMEGDSYDYSRGVLYLDVDSFGDYVM